MTDEMMSSRKSRIITDFRQAAFYAGRMRR
jgi:hypothetical protein